VLLLTYAIALAFVYFRLSAIMPRYNVPIRGNGQLFPTNWDFLLRPCNWLVHDWGGPVETDSELRYTDLKVAFKLVRRAIAQRGVPTVEIEVGVEVVGDL